MALQHPPRKHTATHKFHSIPNSMQICSISSIARLKQHNKGMATPIFHLEFTSTNDGTLYITLIDKRLEHAAQFEVRGHLELLSVFQDVPGSERKLMKSPLKDSFLKDFEISSSTYVTLTAFKSKLQLHSCNDLSLQCSKNRWNSQDTNPHQVSG